MMKAVGRILSMLAAAAVLTGAGWLLWSNRQLRAQARAATLEKENALAAADTTVRRIVTRFGELLLVAERRAYQGAVQLQLAGDSMGRLEDALAEVGVAAARFRVEGDSLRLVLAGGAAVEDSAGVRTVGDTVDARDSLGIYVAATVTVPRPPAPSTWAWELHRAPLPLQLELSCRGTSAIARVGGPPWATLTIDSVVQQDAICIPPVSGWSPFRIEVPSAAEVLFTVGAWEIGRRAIRWLFGGSDR